MAINVTGASHEDKGDGYARWDVTVTRAPDTDRADAGAVEPPAADLPPDVRHALRLWLGWPEGLAGAVDIKVAEDEARRQTLDDIRAMPSRLKPGDVASYLQTQWAQDVRWSNLNNGDGQ